MKKKTKSEFKKFSKWYLDNIPTALPDHVTIDRLRDDGTIRTHDIKLPTWVNVYWIGWKAAKGLI